MANLGVFFLAVSELMDAPPVKRQPKEYDCTVEEKIELITEENKDT